MSPRLSRALGFALVTAAIAVPLSFACSSAPSADDTITVTGPSLADFGGTNGVSSVFERNCGTLDCHGSDARAMRIYGQYGLRKPPGLTTTYEPTEAGADGAAPTDDNSDQDTDAGPNLPGKQPTTPEEQLANYQ